MNEQLRWNHQYVMAVRFKTVCHTANASDVIAPMLRNAIADYLTHLSDDELIELAKLSLTEAMLPMKAPAYNSRD